MTHAVLRPQDILYRDDQLLGINKPAGVPVHGSRILEDTPETLLAMVRKSRGKLAHVAHRLDRPVSGVVLFAANKEMLRKLGQCFEDRAVNKRYLAVVRGWIDSGGTVTHPLRPPRDTRKTISEARDAVTHFEPIAQVELPYPTHPYATSRYSLLGLYPETGRRHQLRMHMKHISHHLIGDTTYGRGEHNRLFQQKLGCRRLLLHAWSLEFIHPGNGRQLRIEAPLDVSFSEVIRKLGWGEALSSWKDNKKTGAS